MTSDKPDRRWFRLHRSTWIVGLLVIVPLLAIAFTGETIEYRVFDTRERGWPYPFLRAIYEKPGLAGSAYLGTLFSPWLLVANVAIIAMASAACMAAWEWRARRRVSVWQFRLAEIFLLLTAVAAALGWWRWQVDEFQREQSAVAGDDYRPGVFRWGYCGPLWLRRLVAQEYLEDFRRPVSMDLSWVTDEELAKLLPRLKMLSYCRSVEIDGGEISDRGLALLGELPSIEGIKVLRARFSGVGFREWHTRTKLKRLALGNTPLTDEGVREVIRFRNLEALQLDSKGMNDTRLAWLTALTRLRHLDLGGSRITSEGLVHLEAFELLQRLELGGTQVGDSGLVHVARLQHLEDLGLAHTLISDDGLRHLTHMAQLCRLDLSRTNITARAVPILKTMPGLRRVELVCTQVHDDQLVEVEEFLSPRKLPLDDFLESMRYSSESDSPLTMWSAVQLKN